MNAAIVEQIERLYKYYQTSGDKGRIFGYRNALRAIKSIEEPILSADQLEGRPGLGEGIIKKIREFIADGTIKRFEFIDTDPKTKAIQLFEDVWGIGPKGA
jgi:DNA polymerase/3'-5' exonuclease PolX